jgi:hypothetical protein
MALHGCRVGAVEAQVQAVHEGMHDAADEAAQVPMDMALCERHCNDGKVSFQPAGNPPAPLAVAVVPALRVDALQPVVLAPPAFDSPYASVAGPAPPLIGFTVLRL